MPHLRRKSIRSCLRGYWLAWCDSFPHVTFCANLTVYNSAECSFLIYSLRTHTVVESVIVASGVVHSFSSSDRSNYHCTFSLLILSSDATFFHSVLLTHLPSRSLIYIMHNSAHTPPHPIHPNFRTHSLLHQSRHRCLWVWSTIASGSSRTTLTWAYR